MDKKSREKGKLPSWMHRKLQVDTELLHTSSLIKKSGILTVCQEALCPNRHECFSHKRATFLALGPICTRNCSFCHVKSKKSPSPPDEKEGEKIASLAKKLQLQHVVITMVTRDDLLDQGAMHMGKIAQEVKKNLPHATIELLTSDFSGRKDLLDSIMNAPIDVFNHNMETVKRITPKVRSHASYTTSLEVLGYVKKAKKVRCIKSGFMVGIGEKEEEVFSTITDLKEVGVDIITIGQYLQPDSNCLEVDRFVDVEEFSRYENFAKKLGIKKIMAGPYVRSSYFASLP